MKKRHKPLFFGKTGGFDNKKCRSAFRNLAAVETAGFGEMLLREVERERGLAKPIIELGPLSTNSPEKYPHCTNEMVRNI